MGILGITFSHDGTVSLIKDGEHIFSLAEERIVRTKAYLGFPFKAIEFAIETGMLKPDDVDFIAVAINDFPVNLAETLSFLLTENKLYYDIQNEVKPANYFNSDKDWKKISSKNDCENYVVEKITKILQSNGINAPVYFYDHHLCHASSAYFSSGYDDMEVLAITMDGEGDGYSASVNLCRNGSITNLSRTDRFNSAGGVYSAVTKKCGFKVSRHEGKITGLAAYGNPSAAYSFFEKYISVKDGVLEIKNIRQSIFRKTLNRLNLLFGIQVQSGYDVLIGKLNNSEKQDLAAGIQSLLEDRITEIVQYWCEKTNIKNVVLAGGVFANVKFNQKISELKCVEKLYIYPDMGDGGLALGAAMLKHAEDKKTDLKIPRLNSVYLGPEYTDDQIKETLKQFKDLSFKRSPSIASDVAKQIADNKIVGWFQGRMEYGPRALGSRSVLASPVDSEINKWLNDRMNRTEFMPFAPSCLYEFADEVFEIENQELMHPAEFMTLTFRVRNAWAKKVPAVVHIDQTARPQLVKETVNPLYHQMLKHFYKNTGLPLVVNTSFNAHEEPIVCQPVEAVNALVSGMIDVLAIGNFVVKHER